MSRHYTIFDTEAVISLGNRFVAIHVCVCGWGSTRKMGPLGGGLWINDDPKFYRCRHVTMFVTFACYQVLKPSK